MLAYFEPSKKGKQLGEVALAGAVVSRVHGDPKYSHRFQVTERTTEQQSGRTFELRAHSDEEMRAWVDAIQTTIGRLEEL